MICRSAYRQKFECLQETVYFTYLYSVLSPPPKKKGGPYRYANNVTNYSGTQADAILPFKMTLTTFEYGGKVADGFQSHKIWR